MHTIKIDPWRFHHNGDFVGTVVVTNETMPDFAGEDASDWLNAALAEVARLRAKDADVSHACARILDAKPAEIAALYRAAWDINSAAWEADDELRRARAEVERLRAENAELRQRRSVYPADACQYCGAPILPSRPATP